MTKTKDKNFNMRIDSKTLEELDKTSKEEHRSKTTIVELALKDYLKKTQKKRKKLMSKQYCVEATYEYIYEDSYFFSDDNIYSEKFDSLEEAEDAFIQIYNQYRGYYKAIDDGYEIVNVILKEATDTDDCIKEETSISIERVNDWLAF